MKNREERVAFLDDCGFKAGEETPAPQQQRQLHNRDGKAPVGKGKELGGDKEAEEKKNATLILNRAAEIENTHKVSPATAVTIAQRELNG